MTQGFRRSGSALRRALGVLPVLALAGCHGPQVRSRLAAAPPRLEAPAAATAPAPEPDAAGVFSQAVGAFKAGRYDAAAELFGKALTRGPHTPEAAFDQGLCYERSGQTERAKQAYRAALERAPGYEPALLNLGALYRSEGDLDGAIALYEGALRLPGKELDGPLWDNLAAAYRLARRYPEAEAAARRALGQSEKDAAAAKSLALVYYETGSYRLAELLCNSARKYDDADPELHNVLGLVALKLDDVPRAVAEFNRAVSLDASFAPAYRNLGALALEYRDYAGAERAFAMVLGIAPKDDGARRAYAYALARQGRRDPAKGAAAGAQFDRLLAEAPRDIDALCGAGFAYASSPSTQGRAADYLRRCGASEEAPADRRRAALSRLQSLEAMARAAPRPNGQPAPGAGGGTAAGRAGGSRATRLAPGANPAERDEGDGPAAPSADGPERSRR